MMKLRIFYLQKGRCQPSLDKYLPTDSFGKTHWFSFEWYENRRWFEYGINKDVVFSCVFFGYCCQYMNLSFY